MSRRVITGETFTEERPLFAARETDVIDCVFDKGESPLKEVSDIKVKGGAFRWKYPLWYAKDVDVEGLKLINCRLSGTSLAFEYSTVDAEISDKVDSVILKTEYLTAPKAAISITSYPPLKYGVAAFFKKFWTLCPKVCVGSTWRGGRADGYIYSS